MVCSRNAGLETAKLNSASFAGWQKEQKLTRLGIITVTQNTAGHESTTPH